MAPSDCQSDSSYSAWLASRLNHTHEDPQAHQQCWDPEKQPDKEVGVPSCLLASSSNSAQFRFESCDSLFQVMHDLPPRARHRLQPCVSYFASNRDRPSGSEPHARQVSTKLVQGEGAPSPARRPGQTREPPRLPSDRRAKRIHTAQLATTNPTRASVQMKRCITVVKSPGLPYG